MIVGNYRQILQVQPVPTVAQSGALLEEIFAVNRLPAHSESILGQPQEPISIIVLADDEKTLVKAFGSAEWRLADGVGFATLTRAALAAWFNGDYDSVPITPAFWSGRPHDFGFQATTVEKSLRKRHHARFWNTDLHAPDGQLIFVGTASFDEGLKWGLTHLIDLNIDAERKFL